MDESFGGGFTTGGELDQKQEHKAEGVLPVFIKMIQEQPEDTVNFFGAEYKMLKFIAIVRSIEHTSTKITYEMEDFSGKIPAHLWVEEGEAPPSANIMLNSYARVVGSIRVIGGVKTIMIFNIHHINGINEVNAHYIEVVNARFAAEEILEKQDTMTGKLNGKALDSNEVEMETDEELLGGKVGVVYKAIRDSPDFKGEDGFNRRQITNRFPNISAAEMNSILERMVNTGFIYTTIDNDHFAVC